MAKVDCKHTNTREERIYGNNWVAVCTKCGTIVRRFTR